VGVLTPTQRAFLLAIAPRFVPAAAAFGAGEADEFCGLIDEALAERPAALQRQFGLLLAVLRWAPAVRYGRPLDALPPARQDGVLRRFQDAPVQKLRSGFWGLRTMIYIGFYGRPAAGPAIGYTPSRDGNALLHARTAR
jgi:hypothetical protein